MFYYLFNPHGNILMSIALVGASFGVGVLLYGFGRVTGLYRISLFDAVLVGIAVAAALTSLTTIAMYMFVSFLGALAYTYSIVSFTFTLQHTFFAFGLFVVQVVVFVFDLLAGPFVLLLLTFAWPYISNTALGVHILSLVFYGLATGQMFFDDLFETLFRIFFG